MRNTESQPNFNPHPVEELTALLREELPLFEEAIPRWQKLIAVAKGLLGEKATTATPPPCHSCANEENCSEPRDQLDGVLVEPQTLRRTNTQSDTLMQLSQFEKGIAEPNEV